MGISASGHPAEAARGQRDETRTNKNAEPLKARARDGALLMGLLRRKRNVQLDVRRRCRISPPAVSSYLSQEQNRGSDLPLAGTSRRDALFLIDNINAPAVPAARRKSQRESAKISSRPTGNHAPRCGAIDRHGKTASRLEEALASKGNYGLSPRDAEIGHYSPITLAKKA